MEILNEGKIKFYSHTGEPSKKMPVFYNPEMGRQRDLTIAVLSVYQRGIGKELEVCDPLAGSGVRGIRILKEVEGIEKVVFNDITSEAVKLIKKNLKLNKIKNKIKTENKDARILLLENRSAFDFIDIDPFGSPIRYLEPSAFAIKHRGLFAATATDTGALAGSFPKTCLRKYGTKVCKTDFYKELGIRVLVTAIQKAFARYGAGFIPLLSHSNHFFRVFGVVEKNKAAADKVLSQIGFVSYCKNCLWRVADCIKICESCKSKTELIGPIWLGQIQDNEFIKKVSEEADNRNFKIKLMEEENIPFYYDIHEVSSKHKLASLKMGQIIENLRKSGFKVSRSSLCPTGIKTDAGIEEVVEATEN